MFFLKLVIKLFGNLLYIEGTPHAIPNIEQGQAFLIFEADG